MLHQILMLLQQLSQPVLLPSHSIVQDQMRVCEDASIKQPGLRTVEEVLLVP